MRAISLFLGLATLGIAAVLPRNATDGVYVVTLDDAGNEVHRRVADPLVLKRGGIGSAIGIDIGIGAERAYKVNVKCHCYHDLPKKDVEAAVADLKWQVGPFQQFGFPAIYSRRGDVVAFACNPGLNMAYTSRWLIPRMLDAVTQKCGKNVIGASTRPSSDSYPEAYVGYMQYLEGYSMCTVVQGWETNSC